MTLDEMLDKLEGVRPGGTGYVALCPGHDDDAASLGVTEGDDGRILLNCYAGCTTQHVLETMGLQMRDLFPNTVNYAEPEAVYEYVDEQGVLLFEAVRFPGKRFRQRHTNDEGEEVWNLDGVRRVLYRLPEVIAAVAAGKTIYITEGEKDAETIRATGRVATCNPMGAGKWRDEYIEFLRGANVIICADRDEPGRAHATRVANSLQGVAAGVWIRQAKRGKDVTDHLEAGFDLKELVPLRQGPRRGIVTAREMAESARERLEMNASDLPGYELVDGCGVVARPGRMYALGAYTGDGKTTFALQATRKLCMDGRNVGYFSLEMPEQDLVNRLIAHRGVPLRLTENPWLLRADEQMLGMYELAVEEIGHWSLDVIFDTSVNAEKVVETTRDREYDFVVVDHIHRSAWGDRRQLEANVQQLTNLALEFNIPVLLLCQLRKFQRGQNMAAFPRPTIQDFRETSQIADDASMALALWRQRDETGTQYVSDLSEFIILKNRHTTSHSDASGQSKFLNFDIAEQLYTTGGGHVSSVAGNEPDGDIRSGVGDRQALEPGSESLVTEEEWWSEQ